MSENNPTNGSSELYRFNQQIVRVPVGGNQELLHCDLTGATSLVRQNDVRMLQACQKFATLDEHAQHVCSALGYGSLHLVAVRQQLGKFAEAGMIVPLSMLVDWCKNGTVFDTAPPISSFGVLTRNRPESLKQCLDSYGKCVQQNERNMTFVIADQSDREFCAHNAEAINAARSAFGIDVWHIDLEGAARIAKQLSDISGVPSSLVNFALTNSYNAKFGGGANRNLLLLSSVGELALQSDDDSTCRVMPTPGAQPGLVLSSSIDPAELWFPTESEISAMEQGLGNQDLFAIHETHLGKSVRRCVLESDGPVDLDATTPSFYWRLNNEPSKVITTNAGLIGESGRGEGQAMIVFDGERRNRIAVSEEHYRYVQRTQRILRGVTRPTITEGAVCYGFNLGLDNREIIPPFMPILRGEDSMFTAVFRASTTKGFFTILPWLVYHAGAGGKTRCETVDAKRMARLVFCDVVSMILQSCQARTFENSTELRLRSIRDLLVEIGSLPASEFERVITTMWWEIASRQLIKLEQILKVHSNKPEYWSKDIASYIEEYRHTFADPRSIVGADIRMQFGETEAFDKQQELIRQYGELIGAWGALREAAITLRNKEGSFGRRA